MISDKVMKLNKYDGTVIYKIACGSLESEDDAVIEFKYNRKHGRVDVNFCKEVKWYDYWEALSTFDCWKKRIKYACKLLFTGSIKLESNFTINQLEHLDSVVEALQEGRSRMLHFKRSLD